MLWSSTVNRSFLLCSRCLLHTPGWWLRPFWSQLLDCAPGSIVDQLFGLFYYSELWYIFIFPPATLWIQCSEFKSGDTDIEMISRGMRDFLKKKIANIRSGTTLRLGRVLLSNTVHFQGSWFLLLSKTRVFFLQNRMKHFTLCGFQPFQDYRLLWKECLPLC